MSYSEANPATWSRTAASTMWIAVDVGLMQDHSAFVVAGVWPQAGSAIGVIDIKRFPLGFPLEDFADEVAAAARLHQAKVIVDASNNSAFVGMLAQRLPTPAANHIIAAAITSAMGHAAQPTPMAISLGGLRSAVPRWTLSKSELVQNVAAELTNKSLRLAKVGEWEALQAELLGMEQTVRASGTSAYAAPPGQHDDLVMALALAVFACRSVGGIVQRRSTLHRGARVSSAAWT